MYDAAVTAEQYRWDTFVDTGSTVVDPDATERLHALYDQLERQLLTVEQLPHLKAAALDAARKEIGGDDMYLCRFAVHLDSFYASKVGSSLFPMLLRQRCVVGDLLPVGVIEAPAWLPAWLNNVVSRDLLKDHHSICEPVVDGDHPVVVLEVALVLWEPTQICSPYQHFSAALRAAYAITAKYEFTGKT